MLSPENVEQFRQLLVAGRDRARIKEYEDASINRVQGPALVEDVALQKAYVTLNSKGRRLGDELVRVTRVIGRPDDLGQTVRQIISNADEAEAARQAEEEAIDRWHRDVPLWLRWAVGRDDFPRGNYRPVSRTSEAGDGIGAASKVRR